MNSVDSPPRPEDVGALDRPTTSKLDPAAAVFQPVRPVAPIAPTLDSSNQNTQIYTPPMGSYNIHHPPPFQQPQHSSSLPPNPGYHQPLNPFWPAMMPPGMHPQSYDSQTQHPNLPRSAMTPPGMHPQSYSGQTQHPKLPSPAMALPGMLSQSLGGQTQQTAYAKSPESVSHVRKMVGWPFEHPAILDKEYNGLHPSKIPDSAFLDKQHNQFLTIRDPFENGSFDASRTPWWTHWVITVAHALTNLEEEEICRLYKWRYRSIIPGIKSMTPTDEIELWIHLDEQYADRYAFDWDEKDEDQMREWVWDYLDFARKDLGLKGERGANMRGQIVLEKF